MGEPGLIDRIGLWIDHWIKKTCPAGPPPILGIAGSQGSGKSTLAHDVAERFGGATLSLDDVYLTKPERADLAARVHPLFATRGPPGTHDLGLLHRFVDRLGRAGPNDLTPLPRFDKLADDRAPEVDWPGVKGRPRVIVLEGWCLGATAQAELALVAPINGLEAEQDAHGLWRGAINEALTRDYAPLRARLDALILLKAPSFDAVLDWRCEQEAGLMKRGAVPPERRAALAVFVQHYERLTRHMIEGGVVADLVVELDRDRRVLGLEGADFLAATGGVAPEPASRVIAP
ncbi:kinase [Brevundimonas sp. G8]|uniref:kinase n=1 Tax=Brevundimonas sp. G8 TaxID=1350776 RepID=UPI0012F2978C|nr:kinase [Brevundimonas sp. G8]VXB89488.1 D-glycerate 3-kinase, plant type [Brevundimonas sp. G8]